MNTWQVFIKGDWSEDFAPANIGSIVFPNDWLLEHPNPFKLSDRSLNIRLNCKGIKWSRFKDYLLGEDKDKTLFKLVKIA